MTPQYVLWGVTWGNNLASAEWSLLLAVPGWLLRHHAGRHLAAWWDRHYGPYAVARHKQALAEHEAGRRQP